MTTQPADTMEQRVSRLEGAYEQVNERLGDLAQGLASLRTETSQGFAAIRTETNQGLASLRAETNQGFAAIRAEMNSRFNILLILIGTLWATTVGGFIALFTRL